MTNIPLVSAVIPAFNSEQYVGQAIESVLRQSYPRIECIVVNDGSTDATGDAIDRYGDAVTRVDTEHVGVSHARNEGIRRASGEYIALLDADDVWLDNKTTLQMDLFANDQELALVYGAMWEVNDQLEPLHFRPAPNVEDALRNTLLMLRSVIFLSQTAIMKKAVLGETPFDPQLSTSADCDLACRIAASLPVGVVEEPVAMYRQHPGQMHHDLHVLERDMLLVYERFFSQEGLDPMLESLQSQAQASLYFTLGALALRKASYGASIRGLVRGLVANPLWTARLLGGVANRRASRGLAPTQRVTLPTDT